MEKTRVRVELARSRLVGVQLCRDRVLIFRETRLCHLLFALGQGCGVAATRGGRVLVGVCDALIGRSGRLLVGTLEEYLLVDGMCAIIARPCPKSIRVVHLLLLTVVV